MDNLAHTLVGAALAEAGLKRKTALATPTLIIAANLPDVDALAMFAGNDTALYFRRGWTHGVLAWLILPAILVGVMLAWDRFVRRRRDPDAKPVRLGPLIGLSYLGLLTHPFLDWLNTYGVRVLMPFDGTWFYGDSLFIVDPWLWLLCGSAVILAHSHSKISVAGWTVLGCAATALVWGYGGVALPVKVAWGLGVATIVVMRLGGWFDQRHTQIGAVTLTLAAMYVCAMIFGTVQARSAATAHFADQGVEVESLMAGPVPGDPLVRSGLLASPSDYHYFEVDPLADPSIDEPRPPLARQPRDRIIEAALAAPQVRGFQNWMRFPYYQVDQLDDGWRVTIRDLRYAEPDDERGFGVAVVELDEQLEPRKVRSGR